MPFHWHLQGEGNAVPRLFGTALLVLNGLAMVGNRQLVVRWGLKSRTVVMEIVDEKLDGGR